MRCRECSSYAINHHFHGRDGSDPDLCDVCYWRLRCVKVSRALDGAVLVLNNLRTDKNGREFAYIETRSGSMLHVADSIRQWRQLVIDHNSAQLDRLNN